MDHSDGDGEINRRGWMRQAQVISNDGGMRLVTLGDLDQAVGAFEKVRRHNTVARMLTDRSEAMMKTLGLTARYFPLPHPTSRPIEPSGRPRRKCSTIGHGYKSVSKSLSSTQRLFLVAFRKSSHLVPCRREVRGYLFVHLVNVGELEGLIERAGWHADLDCWIERRSDMAGNTQWHE